MQLLKGHGDSRLPAFTGLTGMFFKKNTLCTTMNRESLEELLCTLMKPGSFKVADRSEKMD